MRINVAGRGAYAYTGSRDFDPSLPTLAFVHGAANDHSVWALQSRYFAHHGWNVVAVDLPGHGRTGGEPLATVPAVADWLVSLLDALRVERAALVGHSMGALATLHAAAGHPDRVTRLALLGASAPMPVGGVLLEAARRDDHLALELITGWSYSPSDQLGGNPMPGLWMTGNGLRLMERSRPGELYADLKACHEYADGLGAAARVRCPTLVVIGERDQMVPPQNAAGLIGALADRRVVRLRDCGHSLMLEAPDAVLDALREFVVHGS
ncbi:MAG TPA: alpha/beta hydrolase [Casimicrobiaceae bacterium]|nr:alpha/beta hydrolase [Casimicrobiaceae bacterium]